MIPAKTCFFGRYAQVVVMIYTKDKGAMSDGELISDILFVSVLFIFGMDTGGCLFGNPQT